MWKIVKVIRARGADHELKNADGGKGRIQNATCETLVNDNSEYLYSRLNQQKASDEPDWSQRT